MKIIPLALISGSLFLSSCNTFVGVSRDVTTASNKVAGVFTGNKESQAFKPLLGYKDGYDPASNTYETSTQAPVTPEAPKDYRE